MAERYWLAEGAVLRFDSVRGEMVLLLPERVVFLNESATEILELCQGRTLEEILEALRERYPNAEPEMTQDVQAFLEEALARGWVCRRT